jgi:hypothetical protein
MKKILSLLFPLAILISGGCQEELQDNQPEYQDGRIFTAAFDQSETRTYVENGNLLRWNAGDQISLFEGNTLNRQYKFDGETGDNSGTFSIVSKPFGTGNDLNCHYAVYPYASDVKITESGAITLTLPAEQSYADNSFGLGSNTMVALTKDINDTFLKFRNIGGYLKLQLYGDNITVKSITLTGNNNEKLAGKATITPANSQNPTVAMKDDATTSITLDCGEGVKIGSTEENATAFWIVVPPTTFEEGLTITVTEIDGDSCTKSTSNVVVVERNIIKPMAAFEVEIEKIHNNQIWYTSSDGQIVKPFNNKAFGTNIISNTYENGKGIITFDGNVTQIGKDAFQYCSRLTSVTIPDSISSIGESAFHDCTSLTGIMIPDSVMSIGEYAFRGCNNMTSISIGSAVTTIGLSAFWDCTGELIINSKIVETNYPTRYSPPEWLQYSEFTSLTIGDNIEIIGDRTFCYCSSLESITIPDSVKSIGKYAFYDCKNLASISIGQGVTLIKDGAFQSIGGTNVHISDLSAWCNIDFTNSTSTPLNGGANLYLDDELVSEIVIPSDITEIKEHAFYRCESLTTVTIPNGVTSIGYYAFRTCSNLTSVIIPDSVTSIGHEAFAYCSSLESASIPDTVTSIGYRAFTDCSNLTCVTIPSNLTTIREYTFCDCSSLTNVTIPDSVTTIGRSAFEGCSQLAQLNVLATTPPTIDSESFYGCSTDLKVYVPAESLNAYKAAEYWKNLNILSE